MYGLLFSQVCIKLQQWWLYPKIPQKPSATEKKRAARWEPWRTPALESPVLFRQDMEASKKNPSRSGEAKSQCWTAPGITTSISRCVKREKEKEGRKQLGTTLQHCNILLQHCVSNTTSQKERPSAASQRGHLLSVGPWESHLSFLRLNVNNGELRILILLPTIDGKIKGD